MTRALVGLLFVSACSQWFGLSNAPSDDPDGDHIPSASDNCPTVYNPDQSDLDGNGVGDACDTCGFAGGSDDDDDGDGIPNECDACDNRDPDTNGDGVPDSCETLTTGCPNCLPCALGPEHDEDGDLIADACDPCAIDGTGSTADADGDGVGDACDVSTNRSHQLFDAFAAPNPDWFDVGAGIWNVANDRVQINSAGPANFRFLGTGLGHFAIRTVVAGSAGPNNAQVAGALAIRGEPTSPDERFTCSIAFPKVGAPTFSFVHALGPIVSTATDMPLQSSNHYQIVVAIDTTAGVSSCTVTALVNNATATQMVSSVPSSMPFQTGIGNSGGGNATFEYFQMTSDN